MKSVKSKSPPVLSESRCTKGKSNGKSYLVSWTTTAYCYALQKGVKHEKKKKKEHNYRLNSYRYPLLFTSSHCATSLLRKDLHYLFSLTKRNLKPILVLTKKKERKERKNSIHHSCCRGPLTGAAACAPRAARGAHQAPIWEPHQHQASVGVNCVSFCALYLGLFCVSISKMCL